MQQQIEAKSDHRSLDLDDVTTTMLSAAVREVGLDPVVQRCAIAVARTIVNLDQRERIELPHLMEAINYRAMRL